jgi:uncharacterized protein with von Willebrand factor type A (vWA) domain
MDPQELRALLGFDEPLAEGVVTREIKTELELPKHKKIVGMPSIGALRLDQWDIAEGQRIHKLHHSALHLIDSVATADFYAAAYLQEPQVSENPGSPRRAQFIEMLFETPEYKALHAQTVYNSLASEMAALSFAKEYMKLLTKDLKHKEKKERRNSYVDLVVAADAAASQAMKDVDEMQDMMAAMGHDQSEPENRRMDRDKLLNLYRRVRSGERLREIFNRAGRYRVAAQAIQRQKTTHGMDDMVGVELSGDIGRLLPSELAQLGHPMFKLQAMRRLVERESMSRQYRGVQKLGKGPVIVCVDESGSMDGEPIYNAKAYALSMAYIARMQKRWCALVSFSSGSNGTYCVLKPGAWDEQGLLDWLDHFYNGGTTLDVPLSTVPFQYWQAMDPPRGKTDMIIITDAQVHLPQPMRDRFLAWKVREQVKAITLVIGGEPGALSEVSDYVHRVQALNVSDAGIQRSLSI